MTRSSNLMNRLQREKGMAIVAAAVILLITVPMVGLAIDVSMLFIAKTRLQGAVDGAALQGARSLARGANGSAQIANAQTAATAYVKSNFPSGFFFSSGLTIPTPTVDLSVQYQRSVVVTADVQVPAMFERMLGFTNTTVRASATATRKDVNIMIALDRSGSLQNSGSCGAMKQAAVNFVNQFANLRDNVGLITFATSSWLDFALQNNFNPAVATAINSVSCNGSTITSQALWQSYSQLVQLNQPGAMNTILLFTDGQPTGIAVDMPIKAASSCGAAAKPTLRGHFGTTTGGSNFGLLNNSVSGQPIANGDINPAPNSTGCTFMNGWAYDGGIHNMTNMSDFNNLPETDIWGNRLDNGFYAVTRSSGNISVTSNSNGSAVAFNAADSAAARIRAATPDPANAGRSLSGITIYTIALGNAGLPASAPFLSRLANDPGSAIYDSSKPAGMYVYAANTADLNTAFQRIASEVLRLSR